MIRSHAFLAIVHRSRLLSAVRHLRTGATFLLRIAYLRRAQPSICRTMMNLILPPELIMEILLRLPVSCLLRLKCVCKSWLSLISDSNFEKSHYDLAAKPTYRVLFKTTCGFKVSSIDLESSLHDHTPARSHVLPRPLSPHNLIYGSCRGFLLLDFEDGNLLVWNPATGLKKNNILLKGVNV